MMEEDKRKRTHQKRRRRKQNMSLRLHQYMIVKLFKTMRILLKKLKAKKSIVNEELLKKLMKLRKWMDMFGPVIVNKL